MLRVTPSFICFKEKKNKSNAAMRTPTWTLASQGLGGVGGEAREEEEGGGRRPGQAGDTVPGNHSFPGVLGARAPPYLPRPSASPTQVTPNLRPPRPPSLDGPSPFEKRSRAPWAGTAPGEHCFPKTKAGSPRPARCPGPSPRPLGA